MNDRRSKFGTEFGSSVSRALVDKRMSQADLAEAVGRSTSYTNQVLTGRKPASPEWADLIADTLGLSDRHRQELHFAAAKDAGFKLDLTRQKLPRRD